MARWGALALRDDRGGRKVFRPLRRGKNFDLGFETVSLYSTRTLVNDSIRNPKAGLSKDPSPTAKKRSSIPGYDFTFLLDARITPATICDRSQIRHDALVKRTFHCARYSFDRSTFDQKMNGS